MDFEVFGKTSVFVKVWIFRGQSTQESKDIGLFWVVLTMHMDELVPTPV